jgi:hypothetical protein
MYVLWENHAVNLFNSANKNITFYMHTSHWRLDKKNNFFTPDFEYILFLPRVVFPMWKIKR